MSCLQRGNRRSTLLVLRVQCDANDMEPCVWMCAGHISYRLCTRDFDCEHCPLDAALRGEAPSATHRSALYHRNGDDTIPADRVYSAAHTWAFPMATPGRWRIGIDAFAAALIGCVTRISCEPIDRVLCGDALCTFDMGIGVLKISSPLGGRVQQFNPQLIDEPGVLIAEPYADGWIAEIDPGDGPAQALLTPAAARWQLSLDMRRFRRAIAFRLLASVAGQDARVPAPDHVGDLRTIVGGRDYVACVREFVH